MEASDDAARLDLRDLVIFAVKVPALASAASAARPMIGADTLIVPMLNGVPWWFLADRGESLSSVVSEIGRASGRERGGPYVLISVGDCSLKQKKQNILY